MDNDFGIAYEDAFRNWADENPSVISNFTTVRHDSAAASLTDEMQQIKDTDPDVYISMTAGNACLFAIQEAGLNGLKASIGAKGGALFTPSVCSGISDWLQPAGSAADGWLNFGSGTKHITDPLYADEPFSKFVRDNLVASDLNPRDDLLGWGYRLGFSYVEALRIADALPGGITRTNLILAIRSLDFDHPLLPRWHSLPPQRQC